MKTQEERYKEIDSLCEEYLTTLESEKLKIVKALCRSAYTMGVGDGVKMPNELVKTVNNLLNQ